MMRHKLYLMTAIALMVLGLTACGLARRQPESTAFEIDPRPESTAFEIDPQPESIASEAGSQPETTAPLAEYETSDTPATVKKGTAGLSEEEKLIATIAGFGSLKASAETNKEDCVVDISDSNNPYGITWDYGEEYEAYADTLDWRLLFDVKYYKQQFPVLAFLYHDDDSLLSEHFKTVGIREGRQGSKDFNVVTYMEICPKNIREAFGDNYAAYYLYWMAKGHDETGDWALAAAVKGDEPKQLTAVLTAVQAYELEQINGGRSQNGVADIVFDSELSAFSEYRAWVDAAEGWKDNDWINAPENKETIDRIKDFLNTRYFSSNTAKNKGRSAYTNWYGAYKDSESCSESMFSARSVYIGISNPHFSQDLNKAVQYDIFSDKYLDTALNRKEQAQSTGTASVTDPSAAAGQESVTPSSAKEQDNILIGEEILGLASEKAIQEYDKTFCVIDVEYKRNPYGANWNYGRDYNLFIKNLDWSLVFDADYYKEEFPGLALQYQYDDKMLLEHFKTVGIHEGRQGSSTFNVEAYMGVCPPEIRKLFGDNYAAYYLYWLKEGHKELPDADLRKGKGRTQLAAVLTAVQKDEISRLNAEREKLGIDPIIFDSELAAIGEFRAWVDAKEGWKAHDWLKAPENKELADSFFDILGVSTFSENTVKSSSITDWYKCYYESKPHHDAMFDPQNVYFGPSNPHRGVRYVQFDMFAVKGVDTPLNR